MMIDNFLKLTGSMLFALFLGFGAANSWADVNSDLIAAAKSGEIKKVSSLLAKKADVNAKDKNGVSPLMMAAGFGHKDVAELLIAKGANVNASSDGMTALLAAVFAENKEVFELLLAKGADIKVFDKHADEILLETALHGEKYFVELALARGAKVNATDEKGRTALNHAVDNNHKDIVELLLNKGADVNARDRFGSTPLHGAYECSTDIPVLLIARGADVNAKENGSMGFGLTLLHKAVCEGKRKLVEVLLNHGADVNVTDTLGKTPLSLTKPEEFGTGGCTVTKQGRAEMIKLLKQHGAR